MPIAIPKVLRCRTCAHTHTHTYRASCSSTYDLYIGEQPGVYHSRRIQDMGPGVRELRELKFNVNATRPTSAWPNAAPGDHNATLQHFQGGGGEVGGGVGGGVRFYSGSPTAPWSGQTVCFERSRSVACGYPFQEKKRGTRGFVVGGACSHNLDTSGPNLGGFRLSSVDVCMLDWHKPTAHGQLETFLCSLCFLFSVLVSIVSPIPETRWTLTGSRSARGSFLGPFSSPS